MKPGFTELLYLLLFTFNLPALQAQPSVFTFTPTNTSAIMLGQAEVDDNAASENDWIAAFSPEGLCVGASQLILFDNKAYFNLPIYGDDPSTPEIDGLSAGQAFTIRLYRSALDEVFYHPEATLQNEYSGWVNTNGIPLPGYSNPEVVYEFSPVEALSVQVSIQEIRCFNSSDGSITLNVIGGLPPYSFSWQHGSTQNPATNLSPGTYSCTVTDALFQEIETAEFELNAPPPLQVEVSSQPAQNEQNNGSAQAEVSGGTPPYMYAWNDPGAQNTALATNLAPGEYILTVTDANDCSVEISTTVTQVTNTTIAHIEIARAFPNPTTDLIFIQSNLKLESVHLLNPQGQQLRQYAGNTMQVDLSGLPAGVYFLQVQTALGPWVSRVVKQ